jgi:hypothetical protein
MAFVSDVFTGFFTGFWGQRGFGQFDEFKFGVKQYRRVKSDVGLDPIEKSALVA